MSLLEPIEQIIRTHHTYLRRILPEITDKIQGMKGLLESEAGLRLKESFEALSRELHKHMLKEEVMLFPSILEVERAALSGGQLDLSRYDIENPLEQMEYEHDVTETFLAEIHEEGEKLGWKKNFAELYQFVKELESDLLLHIELEEENLFKKARKLYIQAAKFRRGL